MGQDWKKPLRLRGWLACVVLVGVAAGTGRMQAAAEGEQAGAPAVQHATVHESEVRFPGLEDRILMTAASYVVLGGIFILTGMLRRRVDEEAGIGS